MPVAACGGDDADQFRQDYNEAVENLTQIDDDIGSAAGSAGGQSSAQVTSEFDEIADTAEQALDDIGNRDPPEDAKDEYEKLLSALEEGVENLHAVADAARSDDVTEVQQAALELAKSGRQITSAESALTTAVDG